MSRKSKAAEFVEEGYTVYVTGRNVQITDAMKDYAMDKLSKIERFNTRIIEIDVTMDIQRGNHRVSIVGKIDHIKIKSQAETNDMYISTDRAIDKFQAQLRRYRTRIRDHHASNISSVDMNVNILENISKDAELEEINDEISGENERLLVDSYRPRNIVSQETRPLKNLTESEAILNMELTGDLFLIFRNQADNKLKVIYRRNDGHFGIIEPE